MAKTVYKYPAPIGEVQLPDIATIVHVGMQNGVITVWAEVPLFPPTPAWEQRSYKIYGTGQPIPDNAVHVTTLFDGPFVWHLYEVSA